MIAEISNTTSEISAGQISTIENYKMDDSFNEENIENESIDISISKDTMKVVSTSTTSYSSKSTKRKLENSLLSDSSYGKSTSETNNTSSTVDNNDNISSKQVTSFFLIISFVIAN